MGIKFVKGIKSKIKMKFTDAWNTKIFGAF